jgi:hypothetical protein
VAYEIPGQQISLAAAADLSTHQFKFVNVDGNGRAALGGAGTRAVGVLQDKPNALGKVGTIMLSGISKVVAGAAVTVGADVMSDASGRAVTATATNRRLGVALATAGGAGEIIPVLLRPDGTA